MNYTPPKGKQHIACRGGALLYYPLFIAAKEEATYGYGASDRGRTRTREAAECIFSQSPHLQRRAYFRLAGQLSQLCAQTLHIFAYYPRTVCNKQ